MGKRLLYIFLFIISLASHVSAQPSSVTVTGNVQSELGCAGDWDPTCAVTHLIYDASDTVWQNSFSIPAGSWEYKAALNNSWDNNYGRNATQNGANIPLNLASSTAVKFYYDDKTHWITDNQNSVIAVATGSFQSELGAPGDWDPTNLRSWLKDPDGNGVYAFSAFLPVGSYDAKVAINESWDLNYGAGGVQNGPNISFNVSSSNMLTIFSYTDTTHLLTIDVASIWSNVQWPLSLTVNTGETTENIYGQVWIEGLTNQAGIIPGLIAQLGYGDSTDPMSWTYWIDAAFNVDAGNNDEFVASLIAGSPGAYSYGYRYAYEGGPWFYSSNLGNMTVLGATSVPEPTTMLLLGLGLLGLAGVRRKIKK
jgi:hypothetical protein